MVTRVTTSEQVRAYDGLTILSFGFRPFFLGGALWAAIAMALWLPMLSGHLVLPSVFSPLEWHIHELIYGYVPAVIAGFLLTAVPNWTGRLPVTGLPLLTLFAIWMLGRATVFGSIAIGPLTAAAIDLLFLASLAAVVAYEIIAAKNTRNLKILGVLGLLIAGNAVFHLEVIYEAGPDYGPRIGISAAIGLIMLVGGRIIPSFTRNWLVKRSPDGLPTPFDSIDTGIIGLSSVALASWTIMPTHFATAILTSIAGILNLFHLSRWAGWRTGAEPLVLILHIAYAFVALGFLLTALGIWRPDAVDSSGGVHAWTAGAIGGTTLAVMTRASLGHTGQMLTATRPTQLIFLAVVVAACARIAAAFDLLREPMLHISALCWVLAFLAFVVIYAPLLLRRKA